MKAIVFILALLVAASPVFSQAKGEMPFTTTSPEANKLLRQALVKYGDANLEEGGRLSKESLAKDPDFAMAYMILYSPDIEQRKQNLAKAEGLKLSADEKLVLAGLKAGIDNKPTKEFFNPVLAKYPKDNYMHFIAMLHSNPKDQVEIGEPLVKRSPEFGPAYNALGYAYMSQNEMGKAEASFNKYMSLSPDLPNAYDSKGDYFVELGNYKEAIALFEKAQSMGMIRSGIKAQRAKVRLRSPNLSDKDVADIKTMITSSMEEYKNGNIDGYLGYQSDQAIEMFGNQSSNIGAANIRVRLKEVNGNGTFTKLATAIKSVQGLGSVALVSTKIEWTFKPNESNNATDFNRNVIFIVRRQGDGSWRNIAFINDMANQTEASEDAASVRKVLSSWGAVVKPGGTMDEKAIEAFAGLYSTQAIEIYANGRSNVGLGNLKARWNGFVGSNWDHSSLGVIGVEVAGRKAVAWGTAVQNFYPKGAEKPNRLEFPWVSVLTKEKDDQWRLLVFHWWDD